MRPTKEPEERRLRNLIYSSIHICVRVQNKERADLLRRRLVAVLTRSVIPLSVRISALAAGIQIGNRLADLRKNNRMLFFRAHPEQI